MEKKLDKNITSLSALINFLPGIAYRCLNDENWTMHFISEGCRQLTGYSPEDIIGNKRITYNDLIYPEDRDNVRDAVERALEKKIPYQMEYRIVTSEGEVKWVWEQGNAVVYDNNNHAKELYGLILDISRRKKAEKAIRESEEIYRTTMNRMSDAVMMTDSDGRFTFVSGNIYKTFGLTSAEVESMGNISHLFGKDFIRPCNLGVDEEVENIEVIIRDKEGTEHFLLVNVKGVNNLWGGKSLYTCRDITEWKKMEEELVKSEERFRTALDNLIDACGIYSAIRDDNGNIVDFKIEYVNEAACRQHKMTKEEQIGKNFCRLFPLDCKNGLFHDYCCLVESGIPFIREQVVYKNMEIKAQVEKAFDIRANKFRDGIIVSWREVTEKKKSMESMAAYVSELERFQKATVQREFRMKDLRDENEKLKARIKKLEQACVKSDVKVQKSE